MTMPAQRSFWERANNIFSRFSPKSRWGKITLWSVVGLYATWLVVGGLIAPPLVRAMLEKELSVQFQTKATIEKMSLNPFTLTLSVTGVSVPNVDGEGLLFGFKELSFSPSPNALWRFAPTLAFARLVEPVIDVTYFGDGRFSFSSVLDALLSKDTTKAPQQRTRLFPFIISNFEIVDGRFSFYDDVRNVSYLIEEIDFLVPFTSTLAAFKETPVKPHLSAIVNGSRLVVKGDLLPFAPVPTTSFTLATDFVALDVYKPYLAEFTPLRLENGEAQAQATILVSQPENAHIEIDVHGVLALKDIEVLSPQNKKVAALKNGIVELGSFNLHERKVEIKSIMLDGLYAKASKGYDGVVDWQRWLAVSEADTAKDMTVNQHQPENDQKAATSSADEVKHDASKKEVTPEKDSIPVSKAVDSEKAGTANTVERATKKTSSRSPFLISGAQIEVKNSEFVWHDATLNGSQRIALTSFYAYVDSFSTKGRGTVPFTVKTGINGTGTLAFTGHATLAPLTVQLHANAESLPLTALQPFLGGTVAHDLTGTLGIDAQLSYGIEPAEPDVKHNTQQEDSVIDKELLQQKATIQQGVSIGANGEKKTESSMLPPVFIKNGTVTLSDVSLGKQKLLGALVSAKYVELSGLALNLANASIEAKKLQVVAPSANLLVNWRGKVLLPAVVPLNRPEGATNVTRTTASGTSTSSAKKVAIGASASPQWSATLQTFALEQGSINIQQKGSKQKTYTVLKAVGLSATASPLSLDFAKTIDISLSTAWQKYGKLAIKGSVRPQPLRMQLAINASQMDLSPIGLALSPGMALQTRGVLTSSVNARIAERSGEYAARANGSIYLGNLRLRERGSRSDFFAVKRLAVQRFALDTSPMTVAIGDVTITKPDAFLVLDKDGVLNVERALDPAGSARKAAFNRKERRKAEEAAALEAKKTTRTKANNEEKQDASTTVSAQGSSKSDDVTGTVTHTTSLNATHASFFKKFDMQGLSIKDGSVVFRDERFKPAFATRLDELMLTLTGFSLASDALSTLDMHAFIEGAPLKAGGTLNPVTMPPVADVDITLTGMDLVPLSPYSKEYIAYPLDRGRLTATMSVDTKDWELNANTHFLIKQLELGEYDDRPGAPNYPIKLGLALLQGVDGSVSLDLPVRGRLDAPNFRIGGVVITAITNLMLKVVTSPFALVGSVLNFGFGGDEQEMDSVAFKAGRAVLPKSALQKAQELVTLLQQRPALMLKIIGSYAPKSDEAGLRRVRLEHQMQQLQYDDLWRSEQEKTTVDAMIIEPDDYDDYLETLYEDAPFEKPKNRLGFIKEQPREVMEQALLSRMVITPENLNELARARARAVRSYMLELDSALGTRIRVARSVQSEGEAVHLELE